MLSTMTACSVLVSGSIARALDCPTASFMALTRAWAGGVGSPEATSDEERLGAAAGSSALKAPSASSLQNHLRRRLEIVEQESYHVYGGDHIKDGHRRIQDTASSAFVAGLAWCARQTGTECDIIGSERNVRGIGTSRLGDRKVRCFREVCAGHCGKFLRVPSN